MKILVIGCGSIGQRHLRNLVSLGVRGLLAFDGSPDRRAQVAAIHSGIVFSGELDPLLAQKPEAAVIALPTSLHVPFAIQAAEAGCHLFIEKPLSHTLAHLDRLRTVTRAKKRVVMVGYNFRFDPCIQRLKSFLDRRTIGTVLAGETHFGSYLPERHPEADYRREYGAKKSMGGGVILDSLSHHIDYLIDLMGGLPTEVFCAAGKHSRLEIDVEDVAQILLRFGPRTIISVHGNSLERPPRHAVRLIGETGTADCDLFARTVNIFTAKKRGWETYQGPADLNRMYMDQMKRFLACAAGKAHPPVDLDHAAAELDVLMKIQESARKGRWIPIQARKRGSITPASIREPKSRPAGPARPARGRVVGVIQVRMGSTRLPGKALMPVLGKPLLWHIYDRMRAAKTLDRIVIATGAGKVNQPIVDFARANGIDCYAGSETDLVERLTRTARQFGAGALVRITGDCPLVDPELIDAMVRFYQAHRNELDYVTNAVRPTYPDGLDLDVFPLETLERLDREVRDPFWREWLTSYVRERPKEFRTKNLEHRADLSALRWTVDYPEDFEFVKQVFERLRPAKKAFGMKDILKLLKAEPALADINRQHTRDAAYAAALKEAGK